MSVIFLRRRCALVPVCCFECRSRHWVKAVVPRSSTGTGIVVSGTFVGIDVCQEPHVALAETYSGGHDQRSQLITLVLMV